MERWTVGTLEGYATTGLQPSNRPTVQHSLQTLAVSCFRNRPARPLHLAPGFGDHRASRIGEDEVLEPLHGLAWPALTDQQARPFEIRRWRCRTRVAGAHDLLEHLGCRGFLGRAAGTRRDLAREPQ